MSIFSSLFRVFGSSNDSEYIKDKNGKFLGRRAGTHSAPTPSSSWLDSADGLGSPSSLAVKPPYWDIDSKPASVGSDKNRFETSLDTLLGITERQGFTQKFSAQKDVRANTERYAESNEGQLDVLKKAKELLDKGKMEEMHILLEAAEVARKKVASKANPSEVWVTERVLGGLNKTFFDQVDDAIVNFNNAAGRKVMSGAWGNERAIELPYDAKEAVKALQTIASTVGAASYADDRGNAVARSSVYSPELIKEARKFDGVSFVSPDPKDKNYLHAEYFRLIHQIQEAHKSNRELQRYRLERLTRATESVISHTQSGASSSSLF